MRYRRADGKNPPQIRVSVREFVEFACRSGDLDERISASAEQEAMLAGARIHRKLQKMAGPSYRAEVMLSAKEELPQYLITIEGRADGVVETDSDGALEILVDEIKGTYADLDKMDAPSPVHLAQAVCYALFLNREHPDASMTVQITYVHLKSEDIRRFQYPYTKEELTERFSAMLDDWDRFLSGYVSRTNERDASMEALTFPFLYREGQESLVRAVYRTVRQKRKLFLMAPTGVGKTMAVLYPAIRAIGEGEANRLFYLTAKTVGAEAPREALRILSDRGLAFRTVQMTSKEKICMLASPSCNPDDCACAKGYFDRNKEAVLALLSEGTYFGKEEILAVAEKYRICPYELTLDLSVWCDALIGDYNYAFHPDVRLRRFFGESAKDPYLFLIDEAHNLVDRARDMYSARLLKKKVLAARKLVKDRSNSAYRALSKLNATLLALKKEQGDLPYRLTDGDCGLSILSMNAMQKLDQMFEEEEDLRLRESLLDFYFSLRRFVNAADRLDEHYAVYTEEDAEDGFGIRLFCTNPSAILRDLMGEAESTVLFSATLLPIGYYRTLLGADDEDYAVYAPSPFDPEKRCVLIANDVSSRYTRRGEAEYRKIASAIAMLAQSKRGNYLVFFPSHKMLRDVFAVYRKEFDREDIDWVLQSAYMSEEDREIFLENFAEAPKDRSLVGFCVMGGIFSEGIDLAGEKLIGTVIVGTGLPQISTEGEILKASFEEQELPGFDYAYRFPGMGKVLQAGGRVIRTMEDRGVILLLDERFLTRSYHALFPREWSRRSALPCAEIGDALRRFWEEPQDGVDEETIHSD